MPPIAARLPVSAACALVVGWPSRSSAHPSGIGFPSFAYSMILPRTTSVSERSITKASLSWRGKVAAIGLVP
jgi:hypothetical protein